MQRSHSTPVSRAGALAALGGSMLVVASMFMPWVDRGSSRSLDYWHISGVDGFAGDQGTWRMSVVLIPLLVLWCALYFVWRSNESRLAWAFGGFSGAMMLYGGDLRISSDLPSGSGGAGELVAAVGLLLLLLGCAFAVAGNVAEPNRTATPAKGR
ncbi:hypothetical protein [Glycomyces arizonensis]|uniref:hypothetical protein n=1 Tax=Glycomyces arizonensis TaxID=256035 RepID=UPI00047943EB|nr:hypothetical protein [Glycomyces arizonensis]